MKTSVNLEVGQSFIHEDKVIKIIGLTPYTVVFSENGVQQIPIDKKHFCQWLKLSE
jgi:hypothetical protein